MLVTLFISALISSTLFPGGSEALLLLSLQQGHAVYLAVTVATVGNVCGSMITYAMGFYGLQAIESNHRISSLLRMKQHRLHQAQCYFQKYGAFSLLFAWLPIIGDPLCLVAGGLRFPFLAFVLLVSFGKLARYLSISWLYLQWL